MDVADDWGLFFYGNFIFNNKIIEAALDSDTPIDFSNKADAPKGKFDEEDKVVELHVAPVVLFCFCF